MTPSRDSTFESFRTVSKVSPGMLHFLQRLSTIPGLLKLLGHSAEGIRDELSQGRSSVVRG